MSLHFCRDCNERADFRCESREVGERRTVKTKGVERVVQPFRDFFLCAEHASAVLTSADPPRAIEPLPHYKPPAKVAAVAVEQPRFGEDWGKR